MSEVEGQDSSKYKDLVVLSIVPAIVAALIAASWAMAHWEIGPYFVNAALAIITTLYGCGYRNCRCHADER